MKSVRRDIMPIRSSNDVVLARQKVRQWAADMHFTLVNQTKLVTAASKLARNTLDHNKNNQIIIKQINNHSKNNLKLVFKNQGPDIPNINAALRDGFTTGNDMGLKLDNSKRLVNDFEIESQPGKGTRITVVRWK